MGSLILSPKISEELEGLCSQGFSKFKSPCTSSKCGFETRGIGNTWIAVAAAAKSLQSCLTLCDPMDGCPPGSSVHGILQARTLEWVAISFSNA